MVPCPYCGRLQSVAHFLTSRSKERPFELACENEECGRTFDLRDKTPEGRIVPGYHTLYDGTAPPGPRRINNWIDPTPIEPAFHSAAVPSAKGKSERAIERQTDDSRMNVERAFANALEQAKRRVKGRNKDERKKLLDALANARHEQNARDRISDIDDLIASKSPRYLRGNRDAKRKQIDRLAEYLDGISTTLQPALGISRDANRVTLFLC
jgi:hypothetical protein